MNSSVEYRLVFSKSDVIGALKGAFKELSVQGIPKTMSEVTLTAHEGGIMLKWKKDRDL